MVSSRKKKSGRKKTSKKRTGVKKDTGKIIAVIALVASLGALGLGVSQIFLPFGAPKIYSLYYEDLIYIDGVSFADYLDELELVYSAKKGDQVLLEFSCEIFLNPSSATNVDLNFDIAGIIFPSDRIKVYSSSVIITSGYMRHYIPSSEAGEFEVTIYATMDVEFSTCNIRHCLFTITVY